jgi:hypothetical protein
MFPSRKRLKSSTFDRCLIGRSEKWTSVGMGGHSTEPPLRCDFGQNRRTSRFTRSRGMHHLSCDISVAVNPGREAGDSRFIFRDGLPVQPLDSASLSEAGRWKSGSGRMPGSWSLSVAFRSVLGRPIARCPPTALHGRKPASSRGAVPVLVSLAPRASASLAQKRRPHSSEEREKTTARAETMASAMTMFKDCPKSHRNDTRGDQTMTIDTHASLCVPSEERSMNS